MPRRPFLAVLLTALAAYTFLLALNILRSALAAAPASAPAAQVRLDPAHLAALLERLGNADFAQRDAAQKELDRATWRDLELLQKAGDASTVPEVKARLVNTVDALREAMALNPPPISLELKDATFPEMADGLSAALHVRLEAQGYPIAGQPQGPTFTLSAKDQPFWDVFFALSQQRTLSIVESDPLVRLAGDGHNWRRGVQSGPLAVIPMSITRQMWLQDTAPGQIPPAGTEMICVFALDPRVRVLQYDWPRFTEITDDLGNNLAPRNPDLPTDANWGMRANLRSQAFSLRNIDKRATRIVSAKGSAHFVVQTAEEHVDVADPRAGQSFRVAGISFNIVFVDLKPESFRVNVQTSRVANPDPSELRPGFGSSYSVPTVIDATGKEFPLRGDGTSSTPFKPPIKLRLTVSTKSKDVTLPFELKDLPLP